MNQRNVLLSAADKTGLTEFVTALRDLGPTGVYASHGTAAHLREAGLEDIIDIASLTGFDPILSHRVVTLHPRVHGGLMADQTPEHDADLKSIDGIRFDMVYVDPYPLHNTILNLLGQTGDGVIQQAIEGIDIGGPTMLRSALKGGRLAVCRPKDLDLALMYFKHGSPFVAHAEVCCQRSEYFLAGYQLVASWIGLTNVGRKTSEGGDMITGMLHKYTTYPSLYPSSASFFIALAEQFYKLPAVLLENIRLVGISG